VWWRMRGVRGVQTPLKRTDGIIRRQGEPTAEIVMTATSAESGNDHDGRCHLSAPRQPRERPRALKEV
jgi:hypothetical protein